MKKYLIVLAALAMVFVGCKKKEKEGDEYTKIAFKQTELSMAVGETYKLNVLYEPTTLDAPTCKWSSSNEEVATVNNGTITALNTGDAVITATLGDLKAACNLTVTSVFGAYEIEDYGVFGSKPQSWVEGSDTTINLAFAGGAFNCRLAYWPVLAWDGNVTYVDGEGFQGEGYLLYSMVPFYTVDDTNAGQYNGVPFGWGSFRFTDTNGEIKRNVGQASSVDKDIYCEYMESYFLEVLNDGDGSNIKWNLLSEAIDLDGAFLTLVDYTGDEAVWYVDDYGLVSAIVKEMNLVWDGDAEAFSYTADIDWFDVLSDDTFNGLVLNGNSEEATGAKQPYELRMISEHYEFGEVENAPALREVNLAAKRHMEMPALPNKTRKVALDKLYKK